MRHKKHNIGVIKIGDKDNGDDWWWLISMKNSVGLMKWNSDDMLVTVFVQSSYDEVIFSQAA